MALKMDRACDRSVERIGQSAKPTVIVTPSAEVADRYAKVMDAEPILAGKTGVMTFAEFKRSAERRKEQGSSPDDATSPRS